MKSFNHRSQPTITSILGMCGLQRADYNYRSAPPFSANYKSFAPGTCHELLIGRTNQATSVPLTGVPHSDPARNRLAESYEAATRC